MLRVEEIYWLKKDRYDDDGDDERPLMGLLPQPKINIYYWNPYLTSYRYISENITGKSSHLYLLTHWHAKDENFVALVRLCIKTSPVCLIRS